MPKPSRDCEQPRCAVATRTRGASRYILWMKLSAAYEADYAQLLRDIGGTPSLPSAMSMTIFWPMVGHRFDGDLMVVGRAVNGWNTALTVEEARSEALVAQRISQVRERSERDGMRWVTELAGNREGYNTNNSAFWRVNRRVSLPPDADDERKQAWSAHLIWSNLYKAAPVEGWNPGGDFLRSQTGAACELLAREIDELNPRRILVLAGRWWFEPFANHLDLDIGWRSGLVEGVTSYNNRPLVIAQHPMTKPESKLVSEVLAAFAGG